MNHYLSKNTCRIVKSFSSSHSTLLKRNSIINLRESSHLHVGIRQQRHFSQTQITLENKKSQTTSSLDQHLQHGEDLVNELLSSDSKKPKNIVQEEKKNINLDFLDNLDESTDSKGKFNINQEEKKDASKSIQSQTQSQSQSQSQAKDKENTPEEIQHSFSEKAQELTSKAASAIQSQGENLKEKLKEKLQPEHIKEKLIDKIQHQTENLKEKISEASTKIVDTSENVKEKLSKEDLSKRIENVKSSQFSIPVAIIAFGVLAGIIEHFRSSFQKKKDE